jgi:hypothetical protein
VIGEIGDCGPDMIGKIFSADIVDEHLGGKLSMVEMR